MTAEKKRIVVGMTNKIIHSITGYARTITTPAHGYVLFWSSSYKGWFIDNVRGHIQARTSLTMQSNEIFVPNLRREEVNALRLELDALPDTKILSW